jgi:localization factor PodJL
MKFGVPWSVKGVRPKTRETAREAARRSGMSLGEWLNTVILEQAAEDGVRAPGHEDEDDDGYAGELAGVHERLDDLTRRIAQFSRTAERDQPRRRRRSRSDDQDDREDQIAELIGRLDRRFEQLVLQSARPSPSIVPPMAPVAYAPYAPNYAAPMPQPPSAYAPRPAATPATHPAAQMPPAPPGLERAVAEIAARQRLLRGEAPSAPSEQPGPVGPAPALAPMLQPLPAQNLSGLEDQLRRITDQIETLRRPGVEEAINALRDELGEIGRALNDAMPSRAIDTIERQIQSLTHRIAENRQAGADQHALAGIEHGLAEVRDALRELTPAEKLVGFNDAVAGLAHKIDLIVAQKDPDTLRQLEHAITTLREMATHVASNETVGRLAAQVENLAEKVQYLSGSAGAADALSNLEERIDALSRALAERAQNGSSVPPRLEALVQSLADKVERIQESRGDHLAVGHLEDRIVQLVERLDASDSRLGHLEAIERGLADLLMQVEDMRANKNAEAFRSDAENAVGVDALKHDLARTQNTLEAVNGTLGSLVDRLAKMEQELRENSRRPPAEDEALELTQMTGRVAARAVPVEPPPAPSHLPPAAPLEMPRAEAPRPAPQVAPPPPEPQPKRMPASKVVPIDPDLPPDQPLEPGSGPPRGRTGARITAPEPPPTKSSFIAAARRAAQAAVQQAGGLAAKSEQSSVDFGEEPARGKMMKRVKLLLMAASIVAIAAGAVQFGAPVLFGDKTAQAPQARESVADSPPQTEAAPAANPLAQLPPLAPAPDAASAGAPMLSPVPSPLSAPALSAPPAPDAAPAGPVTAPAPTTQPANNDVTGSIPSAQPAPAATRGGNPGERLPAELGSARLRNAAARGDGAAAYEIGLRYAEGRGVAVNLTEAARWYERAADKGVAVAQFRYASMLEKGVGVKKDLAQARRYYLAAAGKGTAKAMHNLAVLYAEGIDGKPDYAIAAQWFRKAAEHGIGDSQYNLAVLAARGLGTPKSLVDAYKWFALAAAQGDKEAGRKRDEVAGKMDAKALATAQREVKGFAAKPQPHDAIAAAVPPGGWDDPAPAAHRTQSGSSGSFKVGKR